MGHQYTHQCPRCGFKALVAGGADAGMNATIRTMECLDCQTLFDAVDGMRDDDGVEFLPVPVMCLIHPDHRWREWTHPGPALSAVQ